MAEAAAVPPPPANKVAATTQVEGPVQIITVTPDGARFQLDERRLRFVLGNVENDMKVAIVSVVGAFRTGKSFLLDIFLRYLRWREEHEGAPPPSDAVEWLWGAGDAPLEGNEAGAPAVDFSALPASAPRSGGDAAASAPDASDASDATNTSSSRSGSEGAARSGFKWRGGHERMTTGIWLWSRPFILPLPGSPSGERVAVFLMDTQGMFDSETTQMLTTSIFGLSTLISSYQVYNLVKQVQEDQLQHLVLFTEYGRRVLESQQQQQEHPGKGRAASKRDRAKGAEAAVTNGDLGNDATAASAAQAAEATAAAALPPFQRLELLVRDAVIRTRDVQETAALRAEFAEHLSGILGKKHNQDLVTVREHIHACFDRLSLFMLPHPGFKVAEDVQYDGTVGEIRDSFRSMVQSYVSSVFEENLVPKRVAGKFVTAPQLAQYVVAYCRLFQEKTGFPEAKMLLEATAEASHRNAHDAAVRVFEKGVAPLFKRGYCEDAMLRALCGSATEEAMDMFDELATFGSTSSIDRVRNDVAADLAARSALYLERNTERDPMKVVGPVVIAMCIAVGAWLFRQILDFTCSPWLDVCRRGSQMFAFVYSAILVVMLALGYMHRDAVSQYLGVFGGIASQLYGLAVSGVAKAATSPVGSEGSSQPRSSGSERSSRVRSRSIGGGGGSGSEGDIAAGDRDDGTPSSSARPSSTSGLRRRK